MAWAETVTKLPLDTWAKFYGIHPLHFNGIYIPDAADLCSGVWNQYEWQDADRVGREAIAVAIHMAEGMLEQVLGFRLLPSWEIEEWHEFPRTFKTESYYPSYRNVRYAPVSVNTDWGYLIAGGVERKTLVREDAAVVYDDADHDEYEETATVKMTHASVTSSNACEFRLFYPDEPTKEIRPVRRSVTGTTITFIFRREQAVKTDKLVGMEVLSLLAADDDNFLQNLDVYQVTNDPLTQVTLHEERALTTYDGFLTVVGQPRIGEARIYTGTYDADTEVWTSSPVPFDCTMYDRFQLHYLAGYRDRLRPCSFTDMAIEWERAVAILSAIFLDRPPCTCHGVNETWEYWSRDMAFSGGAEELARYNIDRQELNNPFGTKLGAIHAWKQVKNWVRFHK